MLHRATFAAGFAAGFVAGARAGREKYDQIVQYGQKIAGHPTVQKATNTATAKATELGKTAAAKAPDFAKSAATTVSAQVPKMAASAKQKATDKLPFGGKSDTTVATEAPITYPVDNGQAPVNGVRYSAE